MSQIIPQCQNLQERVEVLLQLLHQESSLRAMPDINNVQASLRKAVSPTFEIVFAGAFSAGKSMLINAVLERELLYSAEGHATGTECYIAYAEANQERVVLTFLSESEVREQVALICQWLGLQAVNINQPEAIELLQKACQTIVQQEGGESKSEKAKQATALDLLLEGFITNRDRIHTLKNATYSMESFNFSNLKEAAGYARRGSNSAVLKRIEYYCHHPLLADGNVLIDTPGIDAPVQKDALLTYQKIESTDTSAVVCVLKPASEGDMTKEETELLEKIRSNSGIRDRVFYVFNRIDETWYNSQLRQRLDNLINSQFQDTSRVYKTSGLLGFYGSQIQETSVSDRFGLDSLFAEAVKNSSIPENTPQFINEFIRYCGSGRFVGSQLKPSVRGYETPEENYLRILSEWGTPLIEQLIGDSGVEEFLAAITHYLTQEKRPQLYANLADDLQPVCISLKKHYLTIQRDLDSQPREIEAMKAQELERLNHELQRVGEEFSQQITAEVNQTVTNACPAFEADFRQLQTRMIQRLDELLTTFSVAEAYRRATLSHPRNATAPLLAVLVEALYYLSNQLEDVLVDASEKVISSFFQRLRETVRHSDYYSQLYRLLGNDGGIEQQLNWLEKQVNQALASAARIECDRFVRESPRFYDEGTFSIYQFRQTLQQTSQGYDAESMIDAEPAIRQLLKLDFEPKISLTIKRNFRQTISQTLKTHLLPMAEKQADEILQKYNQARAYLGETLKEEAEERIKSNQLLQSEIEEKVKDYNQAVMDINGCLQAKLLCI
ncbi:MAG: dynamin-like GTPase family protein [Coleofasciculaceae cyanobacterium]